MDLDTISRQVQEVEGAVVRGVVTEEQASSVLDGLSALASSVGGVEGQARGTSLDHIESGHQEARTLSQRLQQDIADIQQRIARLRGCLDRTASHGASAGNNTEGERTVRMCAVVLSVGLLSKDSLGVVGILCPTADALLSPSSSSAQRRV